MAEFEKIGGTLVVSLGTPTGCERADIVFSCLPGGDALDEGVNGLRLGPRTAPQEGQDHLRRALAHMPCPSKRGQGRTPLAKVLFLDGEGAAGTPGMVAQRKAPIYLAGDASACARRSYPSSKCSVSFVSISGRSGAASKTKFINNLLVTVYGAAIGEEVASRRAKWASTPR